MSPVQFLQMIYGPGAAGIELRYIGDGGPRTDFVRSWEDVTAFLTAFDRDGGSVYYGAATRLEGRTTGKLEDLAELPILWVDIDTLKMGLDIAECERTLEQALMPPTLIIRTGGGLHGIWKLREPLDVRIEAPGAQEAAEQIVGLLKKLASIFAGDPNVCDLPRILRLPGSHNSKPKVKEANKGKPHLVKVTGGNRATYEFDDLCEWVTWQRPLLRAPECLTAGLQAAAPPDDPYLAYANTVACGAPLDVEEALRLMQHEHPGMHSIHQTQLRVSASLVKAGWEDDPIVDLLMPATRRAAGNEGLRWNWKREEKMLRRMIATARKKFLETVGEAEPGANSVPATPPFYPPGQRLPADEARAALAEGLTNFFSAVKAYLRRKPR